MISTLVSPYSFAQPPSIEWQKLYGGSLFDEGRYIQQTSDNGYIVASFSKSTDGDITNNHGEHDYWLLKLDSAGNKQWEKSYGGSSHEFLNMVKQTTDGGYIMVGVASSNDGDITVNYGLSDVWIVKVDVAGDLQWQKSYGGSHIDKGISIEQTQDGGYIVAGETRSNDGDIIGNHGNIDSWVFKINSSGNIVWQKVLGGSGNEAAMRALETPNGYIVGGATGSSNTGDVPANFGAIDVWIVQLDINGAIQWSNTYGGSLQDDLSEIIPTSDGGYVISASSASNDGNLTSNNGLTDYWVFKISSAGTLQWQNSFGGTYSDRAQILYPYGYGYIMAGLSYSSDLDVIGNHGQGDCWLVYVDNSGSMIWSKSLGGTGNDYGWGMFQTSDGGCVIAGLSTSADGDLIGLTNQGDGDLWIIKLSPPADLGISAPNSFSEEAMWLFPNPSSGVTNLQLSNSDYQSLEIYDNNGRRVKQVTLKESSTCRQLNLEGLDNGIYFIRAVNSKGNEIQEKFIKN